ncbi:hypothetical protein [Actinomadura sp. 6K520]|uniref:hypothetical protein n=1 Tax=Actinomadura sp. 6K520 TaxID=2530364 RepID=UPI001A9E39CB|nr:hypothetical protein [Actinomadura sp. 6K520]
MRHVVMFSGGISSWAAARRVADEHGTSNLQLLFADTYAEDEDLYRFLEEAAAQIGAPLIRIADGRTPWQVFDDEHYIGNARVAPCSRRLKQIPCVRWLAQHTDPADTVIHVGIDWSELHRLPAIERGYQPWLAHAPLCDPPWTSKDELLDQARACGLEPPRLYALGFPHNNCGGACVRGGQAAWAHLWGVFPDRYLDHERREQAFQNRLGKNVAVLRERRGGTTQPLTLRQLRQRLERRAGTTEDPDGQRAAHDGLDWGGCGCLPVPDSSARSESSSPTRIQPVTDRRRPDDRRSRCTARETDGDQQR